MISSIELRDTLPRVFSGLEKEPRIQQSEVWLRDVTFKKPESYLIYAESGTGKSSLCAYVYGLRRDYFGTILIDGEDIRNFSIARWCELRCKAIAYLPQEMRIFPELTAMENIMIKNRLTDFYTEKEILDMLERLDIKEKANQRAAILSIGQQQRVAIVRALCQPFDFVLLDEPVSHLDARNNSVAAGMIAEHAQRQNASIIATSVGNHLAIDSYKTLKL